jgi:PAS domain S-box-containing protein
VTLKLVRRVRRRLRLGPRRSRAHLELFLLELSAASVQAAASDTEALCNRWLEKLARMLRLDRLSLWELSPDGRIVYRRHGYDRPGCESTSAFILSQQLPWLMDENRRGNVVAWSRIPSDVPEGAVLEREDALRRGVKSLLSIPIATSSVLCVMTFVSLRRYRRWRPALVRRLRLVAETLAGVVMRNQVEGSLRASEARNRAMLRALPDPVFVFSPDGVYLDFHCRDHSELLVPPGEFIGRRVEEILPPELAKQFRSMFQLALQSNEVIEFGYSLGIRDELREYEARMVRRDDGAIVAIVRNITQYNRSARQLRESEERFRGAFEHSAIGMALVSLEGHWLRANRANCEILGYSEAELRQTSFPKLTHPDDLALNLHHTRRALAGEIDHYEIEKRYVHKDGRTIPALLTVSVVRDSQGRPLYFVSQLQDLTERERTQVEIERLRLELTHFSRLAIMGQLAATLAHQLSQPIAAVLYNAEACERVIADGQSALDAVRESLRDIVASCDQAADTISHVRSLLRKEREPKQGVHLNRLVQEVLTVTQHYLTLHEVRLELRLDPVLPEIAGHPIELRQVILNLLINGAEALLQNVPSERELEIATMHRDGEIELSVRDRGTGIAPEALSHLFEPFYTTKSHGMGMGLAICSEIVRAHQGRLRAENNPAGGMTFRCVLPLPP